MNSNSKFDDYCAWLKENNKHIGIEGTSSQFPISKTFYFPHGNCPINSDLETSFDIVEYIDKSKHVIVCGEPGTGKSTLLKYLGQHYLDNDECKCVPFYVSLSELSNFLTNKTNNNTNKLSTKAFFAYLSNQEQFGVFCIDEQDIEHQFRHEKTLVLFDGFDEITSIDAKKKMIDFFKILSAYSLIKIVITTRPYAIRPYINQIAFDLVDIELFDYEDIGPFIKQIYDSKCIVADYNTLTPDGLLDIIKSSNEIYNFARTPAMLTCLCIVYFKGLSVPCSKNQLFDSFISVLIPYDKRQEREKIFKHVAFSLSKDDRNKQLDKNDLIELMRDAEIDCSEDSIQAILGTGILLSKNKGTVEFWHPYFQDYYFAKHLIELSVDTAISILDSHFSEPEYYEAICFFVTFLLESGHKMVTKVLNYICKQALNCTDSTSIFSYTNLLKKIFENLHYYDYDFTSNEWNQLRQLISNIIYKPDKRKGIIIDDIYNAAISIGMQSCDFKNFSDIYIKVSGTDCFYIGAQKSDSNGINFDPRATEFEQPIKSESISAFEIASAPVLVGEYEAFVLEQGYSNDRYWSNDGIIWRDENNINSPRAWEQQLLYRNLPVSGVSFYEALAFCKWKTITNSQYTYSLPTEAMWEYAYRERCPNSIFNFGNETHRGNESEANWSGSGLGRKSPIGLFPLSTTNNGIIDMIGNIEEWCLNDWAPSHDENAKKDLTGAVVKGGSCIRVSLLCRPTYRSRSNKDKRYLSIGFRTVRYINE